MDIDLDESNYDYEKLLNLFSLTHDFTKEDLKEAKKKVFKLHPDKSNLPNEYFLFFKKMYLKVEEIYKYIHHETSEENLKKKIYIETHFKNYLEQNNIDSTKNNKEFTKEFNKMFKQVYISENKEGYDDWLKSNENMYNKNDLEQSRKDALTKNSIVNIKNEIDEVGVFNKQTLQIFDLKESHGTPFIALDVNEEFNKKQKFKSVQEYQQFMKREDEKNKPLSQNQSALYLQQKEDLLNKQSKEMAYQKMVTKQEMDNKYDKYVSNYLKLNN